ncbi:MAG TPA: isoprenylcysteine carboxylmethyltransferase family protein [Candidatus Limnocylindria bacterium]|nr:isoprenylcysteine carboxylmethyltransferase family protein [Candidatus Limnocylindria bacterium]
MAYGWFAYLGLMTVPASLLLGFRHDASAPAGNYLVNALLYLAYVTIHYVMMTPTFKKAVTGRPEGSPAERRAYITVAVVTWVVLYALHRPLPGPAYTPSWWVVYAGTCAFLLSFLAFLEGATFESLRGLLGIPGGEQTHTAAAVTPLLTTGSYASVRHPMYRGAVCMGLSSLLIHPNAAQLVWAAAIGLTFVGFIPIEERQLLRARGDEYRAYMSVTRYRMFRGVW